MEFTISATNITVEYETFQYRSTTFKEYVFNRFKSDFGKETFRALNNISLHVKKGDSFALLGHNGSGKSTLLKVLAGIIEPPNAKVLIHGNLAAMIELGAGFDGELNGFENVRLSCMIMGLSSEEIDERLESIVNFSELKDFMHMPLKNYSSGMQARLGFACTTAFNPDVLLIDEVLSVGDSNFSRKCLQRIHELRENGTTVVLVSHDPGVVRKFCNQAMILSQGTAVYEGDVASSLLKYEEVMQNRSLSIIQKKHITEQARIDKLRLDEMMSSNDPKPVIEWMQAHFFQDGKKTDTLECCRKFSLRVTLRVKDVDFFKGDVSVGFGLAKANGVRVGGGNNLQVRFPLDFPQEKGVFEQNVTFEFNEGLSSLASGFYKLIIGVHDMNISRTIYGEVVGDFEVMNAMQPINADQDIICLGEQFSVQSKLLAT